MKILVTGACGFVGSTLVKGLLANQGLLGGEVRIVGLDNFSRPGSKQNLKLLKAMGVEFHCGDISRSSDLETLPKVDWVLDCAANPSVLAGTNKASSSRHLIDDNLVGTLNLLEFCKENGSGFILISTSRVYSIAELSSLPLASNGESFAIEKESKLPQGVSERGVDETFSTRPPLSLYGVSKLASENIALEYGHCFEFPVWINRCGVLAGQGQFGRADQGIFSFWINSHLRKASLKYIGFNGCGHQVRDCLHPNDLLPLLAKQLQGSNGGKSPICNLGGGPQNSCSLKQLTAWCNERFGEHPISSSDEARPFDLPWVIMDCQLAREQWDWTPQTKIKDILEEIAEHAETNPEWLALSNPSR